MSCDIQKEINELKATIAELEKKQKENSKITTVTDFARKWSRSFAGVKVTDTTSHYKYYDRINAHQLSGPNMAKDLIFGRITKRLMSNEHKMWKEGPYYFYQPGKDCCPLSFTNKWEMADYIMKAETNAY